MKQGAELNDYYRIVGCDGVPIKEDQGITARLKARFGVIQDNKRPSQITNRECCSLSCGKVVSSQQSADLLGLQTSDLS